MKRPDFMAAADDHTLGDGLRAFLMDEFGRETEAWAVERVSRVANRLNTERVHSTPIGGCSAALTAEILWMETMAAFAAPGRYIYITRELLQRLSSDDAVALVLAHEMAHHDLGHTTLLRGLLSRLRGLPGSLVAAALWHTLERQAIGPEREAAADVYALDLCIAAGFDGRRCLTLFDTLEMFALDHGALDTVYGPDFFHDSETTRARHTLQEIRRWSWERVHGYPPLRERKARLQQRWQEDYAPDC